MSSLYFGLYYDRHFLCSHGAFLDFFRGTRVLGFRRRRAKHSSLSGLTPDRSLLVDLSQSLKFLLPLKRFCGLMVLKFIVYWLPGFRRR